MMKFNRKEHDSEHYYLYVLMSERNELAMCDRVHRNFTQEKAFRNYTAFEPTSCIISKK
jgi:thioredoxin-related protein